MVVVRAEHKATEAERLERQGQATPISLAGQRGTLPRVLPAMVATTGQRVGECLIGSGWA
jgi:hypothetical protein